MSICLNCEDYSDLILLSIKRRTKQGNTYLFVNLNLSTTLKNYLKNLAVENVILTWERISLRGREQIFLRIFERVPLSSQKFSFIFFKLSSWICWLINKGKKIIVLKLMADHSITRYASEIWSQSFLVPAMREGHLVISY